MQTQYVLKQAGLTLPVTKLFQQHIVTLLAEQSQQTSVRAVVINFRDPDYSAESGGFHPVEMRFIRQITNGISTMSQTLVTWDESIRSWKRKWTFVGQVNTSSIIWLGIFHWRQRGMNSGPYGRVILWITCLWGFTG